VIASFFITAIILSMIMRERPSEIYRLQSQR
jgi:hypothetical protein